MRKKQTGGIFRIESGQAFFVWLFNIVAHVLAIVLVLVVFGTSIGVFLGNKERVSQAEQAAMSKFNGVTVALSLYRLDNGFYPTTAQGLRALSSKPDRLPVPRNWNGPYLKVNRRDDILLDPWGNKYIYVYPGRNSRDGYDLISYGKDRKKGGGDDRKNW